MLVNHSKDGMNESNNDSCTSDDNTVPPLSPIVIKFPKSMEVDVELPALPSFSSVNVKVS